jgi:iron-sulfur cluster assembly protein
MFNHLQPVKLSSRAAEEVKKIMQTKNIPAEYGLRIGVRGGHGCGGAQLIIGFDKKKDSDLAYQVADISVLVDKKHTMYVIGKEVDFYEGEDARGFQFVDAELERQQS